MGKSYAEEEENCRLSGTRPDVQRRKAAAERPWLALRPAAGGTASQVFPSAQGYGPQKNPSY